MNKSLKKEIILYSIIAVILIIISFLNNFFWKIGKADNTNNNAISTEKIQNLEKNNITNNIPYHEEWLD